MLVCDLEMIVSELDITVLTIQHRLFALDIGNQVPLTGKKYRNAYCVHFYLSTLIFDGCLSACVLREDWGKQGNISSYFPDSAGLFLSFLHP